MPASATVKGDTTVLWGTGSVYTGFVLSARDMLTGELVEIPGTDGDAAAAVFFNDKHELEVEVMCDSAFALPAFGDTVTINSLLGNVTSAEQMWESKGIQKARIKATRWTDFASS